MKSVSLPTPDQIQTANLSVWKRKGSPFAGDHSFVEKAAWTIGTFTKVRSNEWGAFPISEKIEFMYKVPDTRDYEHREHTKYLQGLLDRRGQSDSMIMNALGPWLEEWFGDSLRNRIERERGFIPTGAQRREKMIQYVNETIQILLDREYAFRDSDGQVFLTEEFIWDCYNASVKEAP